jgi:hypothetical protein
MREFKEVMYMYDKPFVVDSTKFGNIFDFTPTPHDKGISQTWSWYKKHA